MNPFDRGPAEAAAYDDWYQSPIGQRVLEVESRCVSSVLSLSEHPWLDVGCGSGRIAEAVGAEVGADPAGDLLRLARTRLQDVIRAVAEQLPVANESMGGVMAVTVIEFLPDPREALREIHRVLAPGGCFALGFLPATGAWANRYRAEGTHGDGVFGSANFYTGDELIRLAEAAGFVVREARSALFDPPAGVPSQQIKNAIIPDAGFTVLALHSRAEPMRHARRGKS